MAPEATRVRLELARAYFVAGDFTRSRRLFVAVLSGDIPAGVRESVLGFIRRIDARRGFSWDLSVGVTTTGDFGRRYVTDEVTLNIAGQELPFTLDRDQDDGFPLGVRVTGDVEASWRLGDGVVPGAGTVVFLGASGTVTEAEGTRHDEAVIATRGGLRAAWPRTTGFVGPRLTARFEAGEHVATRYGLETGLEHRLPRGLSVFGAADGGWLDDVRDDDREGATVRARLGALQAFGGRAAAGAAVAVDRLFAATGPNRYTAWTASLFADGDAGFGLDLSARAFARYVAFDDREPLFTDRRQDRVVGFDLRAIKTDVFVLDRFTPFVELGASRRRSSIAAFGYDELRLTAGVEQAF